MRLIRALRAGACAALAILLLTGCWDKVELENRGFVVSIGIDKGDRFDVSMSIANVAAVTEKGGGEKESVKTASGATLASAMRGVGAKISQKIYYGHTKVIVLGKDFLEDADLLLEAADGLERNNEINGKAVIMAAEGKGKEVLDIESKDEALVGLYISNFYKNSQKNAAAIPKLDLEHLITSLRLSGCAVIPKAEVEGKELRLGGAAVIKDYKLAGWLTEEEARACLWFEGKAEGAQITAEFEGVKIPFTAGRGRRKISFYEEDGRIVCEFGLNISGSVDEHKLLERPLSEDGRLERLQESYGGLIAAELEHTFLVFRDEFGADGFLLKDLLRKKNYPLYQKYAGEWESAYAEITLEPRVSVTLTNTGTVK